MKIRNQLENSGQKKETINIFSPLQPGFLENIISFDKLKKNINKFARLKDTEKKIKFLSKLDNKEQLIELLNKDDSFYKKYLQNIIKFYSDKFIENSSKSNAHLKYTLINIITFAKKKNIELNSDTIRFLLSETYKYFIKPFVESTNKDNLKTLQKILKGFYKENFLSDFFQTENENLIYFETLIRPVLKKLKEKSQDSSQADIDNLLNLAKKIYTDCEVHFYNSETTLSLIYHYHTYFFDINALIAELIELSEKRLASPPIIIYKDWKTKLNLLKQYSLKCIDSTEFEYQTLESVIRALAKIFLMQTKSFSAAKYVAISICEKALFRIIENSDNQENKNDKLSLYYHLSNFNSHTKHDVWRSSVYAKKLKEETSELAKELYAKVQKPGDQTYSGLAKYIDSYHKTSLEEEPNFETGIEFRFTDNRFTNFAISKKPPITELFDESAEKPKVKLYVLTGKNGSRKTQILDFIFDILLQQNFESSSNDPLYTLYVESEATMLRKVRGVKSYDFKFEYVYEKLIGYLKFDFKDNDKREDISRTLEDNINTKIAIALFDQHQTENPTTPKEDLLPMPDWSDLSFTQQDSFAKKIIAITEKLLFLENSLQEPITIVENIFKQHLNIVKTTFLLDLFKKSVDLKIQKHIFAFLGDEQSNYELCTKYCEEYRAIMPPYKVLNSMMNKYLKGYSISFKWDKSYAPDFYVKYCDNEPRIEDVFNTITIYDKDNDVEHSYYKTRFYSDKKMVPLEERQLPFKVIQPINEKESKKIYGAISELGEATTGKFRFIFRKDGYQDPIELYTLSSGEMVAIRLIFWAYGSRGLDFWNRATETFETPQPSKIKLLLLDEVDKHFDSHLTRTLMSIIREQFTDRGVKVIMTTHKPDTLALVPVSDDSKIFTVQQNNGRTEVVETHKLLAMFRLTGNMREITNFHIKVYVESQNDAWFYQGIYYALLGYSNTARQKYNIGLSISGDRVLRHWEAISIDQNNDWTNRFLSKRYQLSFQSTSFENTGGGGSTVVESSVRRDMAARKVYSQGNKQEKWFERVDAEISKPLGIFDKDYGHTFQNNDPDFQRRFTSLERHSLENYLFDPFILISTLDLDSKELNKYLKDKSFLKVISDFKETLWNKENLSLINTLNKETIDTELNKYFNFLFHKFYIQLKTNKKKNEKKYSIDDNGLINGHGLTGLAEDLVLKVKTKIQEKINQILIGKYDRHDHYDEIIRLEEFKRLRWCHFDTICNHLKPEEKSIYKGLVDFYKDNEEKDIYLLGSPQKIHIILNHEIMIEVYYPSIFLNLRGHNVETILPFSSKGDFKESLLSEYIPKSLNIFIPRDLAQVFFDLNQKVREQVRSIIKLPLQASNQQITDILERDNDEHKDRQDPGDSCSKDKGLTIEPSTTSVSKGQSQISSSSVNAGFSKLSGHIISLSTENNNLLIALSQRFPDFIKFKIDGTLQTNSIVRKITTDKIEIKSNGDCLFNSILFGMKLKGILHNNANTQSDLREMVKEYLIAPKNQHLLTQVAYGYGGLSINDHIIYEIKDDIVLSTNNNDRLQYYDTVFRYCAKGLQSEYSLGLQNAQYGNDRANLQEYVRLQLLLLNTKFPLYLEYAAKTINPNSFGTLLDAFILYKLLKVDFLIKQPNGDIVLDTESLDNHEHTGKVTIQYNGRDHYDLSLDGINLNLNIETQQTTMYCFEAIPNNPLLSIPNLLVTAKKITGSMEAVNRLITLGEDSDISEQIIEAINDKGIEEVIHLFFTKPENSQKSIPLLLEDSSFQNTSPQKAISSAAIAGIISLDLIESSPTIKYLMKEILKLDIELPKISNEAWIATHFAIGTTTAMLLETPGHTITDKLVISGMNSVNYGVRVQLYNSVDKIGLLPTIAIQTLLTLANNPMHQIDNKHVLYNIAISASISGMQYYQYHYTDSSKEKTVTETLFPYMLDFATAIFAIRGINLPDNNHIISYVFFTKQALTAVSSIVTIDYTSKALLSFVSGQIKEVEDYIYSYFRNIDAPEENSPNMMGEVGEKIIEL